MNPDHEKSFRFTAVLAARCPSCRKGRITRGFLGIHRRCPACGYDLHPESGYFLGAMMVAFLVTAMLTVPPMIVLKLADVDLELLLAYPFLQYAVLGPLLLRYSRVLWLHLEYTMTDRLDGHRDESTD